MSEPIRYVVEIPAPSAERMAANRTLRIRYSHGHMGGRTDTVKLRPDERSVEIRVSHGIEQGCDATWIDGDIFSVEVEFSNDSGSRKEVVALKAVKCGQLRSY